MWWLWILPGILFFVIAIAFCIPLVISFRFNGSPLEGEVWVHYAWINKQLFPEQKKKKTKKHSKKQSRKNQTDDSFAFLLKEYGPVEAVSMTVETATALVKALKELLTGAKIRDFQGVFRIGGQDAAEAAIHYGEVCAVLYPFLGFIGSFMTFEKPDLQVYCDYDSPDSEIHGTGKIHVSPLRLPIALVYAFRYLVNQNLEKGGK